MSDGSLSQEEIDALLSGADDLGASIATDEGLGGFDSGPVVSSGELSDEEQKEILALSDEIGQSMGSTLSTITDKTAQITNPQLEIIDKAEFTLQITGKTVQISADYIEGITGAHSYIITEEAARQVAALMMAQDEGDLTEMSLSALTEGFNQMSGASINIFEDRVGKSVKTGVLTADIRDNPTDLILPDGRFLKVNYDFISNGSSSTISEILDINAARSLAAEIMNKKGISVQSAAPGPAPAAAPAQQNAAPFQPGLQQSAPVFSSGSETAFGQGSVGVQPVQFAPLSAAEQSATTGNIGLLMDVSMQLTVELGRTKMLIKDILGMGEGTIVELDKLAGEPVDLLVNGKLIAKGEVVVIDENFGVRVTDIISPMERIASLE
jgi:flagellar motor switch protein FliN/FliY